MSDNSSNLSQRKHIDRSKRILVKHLNHSVNFVGGEDLAYLVQFEVPFAVRRVDLAFCITDDQKTDDPIQLRIQNITDGHTLGTVYSNYSKTFTLYYDPPIQISGQYNVELIGFNLAGQLDLYEAPHAGAFNINLSFYNDYE